MCHASSVVVLVNILRQVFFFISLLSHVVTQHLSELLSLLRNVQHPKLPIQSQSRQSPGPWSPPIVLISESGLEMSVSSALLTLQMKLYQLEIS